MANWMVLYGEDDILHYGVKGMKWKNKKGPGYNGMPSSISNAGAIKSVSKTASKAGASAGGISKAASKPKTEKKNTGPGYGGMPSNPSSTTAVNKVMNMINGKEKIDRNYIIKNWNAIVKNPKLVAAFKKRYPTAYSYVVKNQIGTSKKPVNNHSGGSGGRT